MHLDAEDTRLFLTLAHETGYVNSVYKALRRRGYVTLWPFLPRRRVVRPYRAFAEAVCSWTLQVEALHSHRAAVMCFGRWRVGVLDVSDDGSSWLSLTALRCVPSELADRLGLGPRPELAGEVRLAEGPTGGQGATEWLSANVAQLECWRGVVRDIEAGRWAMWTLTRAWAYDGVETAEHGDTPSVLDTPSGMVRICADTARAGVILRPLRPAGVWAHLCDGPNVTRLALTVSQLFVFWQSKPRAAPPLLPERRRAGAGPDR